MPSSRGDATGSAGASLTHALAAGFEALPRHDGYCIGFSGGRDSTALLDALHHLHPGRVRAVHVHHGLHASADDWAEHCRRFCEARGIGLDIRAVRVQPDGEGPEAAARRARHAALQKALRPGELLVLAHHADDQAETVLFRLLRGGGTAGAAGMRALRPTGDGDWLWRPLLGVTRDAITAYCCERGLQWVDDPGNHGGANARARLRAALPMLEAAVPGAAAALRRHAGLLGDQQALIATALGPDLATRLHDGRLDLRGLRGWSRARRHALLRQYCAALGAPVPGAAWLAECDTSVIAAGADRQPVLQLGALRACRFDDALWLLPALPPTEPAWCTNWDGCALLSLPAAAGSLHCSGAGPPLHAMTVGFVAPGTRCRLTAGGRTQRLKHVFQRAGTPPWERARTPEIRVEGEPVQVGQWRLPSADAYLPGTRFHWRKPHWHLPSEEA